MEYWEFLLQKEGDRTWQPIKSKAEIEAGRYRVVAHSSRINTDVEISVVHESLEEVPAKRRSQKRSRRTNPEGLMVVIPFTYLKPGRWELRCYGDIMSDFLGLSWQHTVQLAVLPKNSDASASPIDESSSVIEAQATEVPLDLGKNLPPTSDPVISIEPIWAETEAPQPTSLAAEEQSDRDGSVESEEQESNSPPVECDRSIDNGSQESEVRSQESGVVGGSHDSPVQESEERDFRAFAELIVAEDFSAEVTPLEVLQPEVLQPEVVGENETVAESENVQFSEDANVQFTAASNSDSDEVQLQSAAIAQEQTTSLETVELDEQERTEAENSAEVAASDNPLLDQSLQMIEQILQQVLEPVMQEFEQPEPAEVETVSESEQFIESSRGGLILTLDEESLAARRGEPLSITGQVDILDVHQLNGGERSGEVSTVFQGSLRYELRDPQTSRILLDIEHSLPQQGLPIAFSHSLEIPADCPTRLILGKVTLYDRRRRPSHEAALASQPFTVTASLEELLGAIIPETRAMPLAKMIAHADSPDALKEALEHLPEPLTPPEQQRVLDLLDVNQNRSLPLTPSSRSPLPPQIYQPTPNSRAPKSIQLPKLPKIRPITASPEPLEQASVSIVDASSVVVEAALPAVTSLPAIEAALPVDTSSSVVQAALPAATVSEPDTVEAKPEDAVEQLQPQSLAQEPSSDIPESMSADTSEDSLPELQLQEAMQQLEEALAQIKLAGSLSSPVETPEVSDSPFSEVEPPNGSASPEEDSADERNVVNAHAEAPETPQETGVMAQSLLGQFEEFDEIDEWAVTTFTHDSSLNRSDATEEEMPSPDVPPFPELVANLDENEDSEELDLPAEFREAAWEEPTLPEEPSESPQAPQNGALDNAFQALKVQDRFWLRLNSLAIDSDLKSELSSPDKSDRKSELSSPDKPVEEEETPSESVIVNVEEVTQPLTSETLLTHFLDEAIWEAESDDLDDVIADTDTEPLQPPPLEGVTSSEPDVEDLEDVEEKPDEPPVAEIPEIDWTSHEFVVDDDDEEPLALEEEPLEPEQQAIPEKANVKPEASQNVTPVEPPPAPPLPQREIPPPRKIERPIPAPELSIPANELAAGEPVTVRVKLPPHPARLCVKLWVQDRQSRYILDGPRWLMDLIPDRKGEQEALTQLTVPFGSVEIRFEAIAVDIDSQRESHKVAIDCVVVPPDLPNFSLDEFEV